MTESAENSRIEEKIDAIDDSIRGPDGLNIRLDRLEQWVKARPCLMHQSDIERLKVDNRKGLAAWGIITLVAVAIAGVVWDAVKKKIFP